MGESETADVWVQTTDHGDGSAEFTLTFADEDHKFSASAEDGKAVVQYEETLSWRGQLRVSEPDDDIFKELMVSEEMTQFIEDNNLDGVRRGKRQQA